MADPETVRAFFAIELNDAVREELAAVVDRLRGAKARASWTRPENLHVTMRFLGDVEPATLAALGERLARTLSELPPCTLHAREIGAFPNARKPRVIWCGLDGEIGALTELYAAIEAACVEAGLDAETRPFRPHITLGRVRDPGTADRLVQVMRRLKTLDGGELPVTAVTLFRSDLRKSGPEYRRIRRFELQCP